MADKKIYTIQINGISESTNAVEALNKQLEALEARIKTLEKSNVKVGTSGGSTKTSTDTSSMDETISKQKEINKLKKEELAAQKAIEAQQRLTANEYDNTMKGMKQNLADLKTVMNVTDLGDTDKIKEMTKDAGALTQKLKDMEQAYGQYGRNVGNYANGVAEGLQKVKVTVGDSVREFDNAKQAAKSLGNELKTMAVNGQQGTKEFKDLQKAVAQLNSDIKDATVSSKAMDSLLDTMQSFASIGSVTQGMSALFGFDDAEIQKSIQKLVALQNVMQGIEKINQQINSQEGIGGWLAKGNSMIDSFIAKITGANKAQEALNASTTAGATASKALTTAEVAQATATNATTVATKALSVALKSIGIGLIVSAVAYLVTNWKELYKWLSDTVPVLKNIGSWFDEIKAIAMGVGSAVVNFLIQPFATLAKVIAAIINKEWDKIPNIIGNGLKETYDVIGNFQKGYNKETERQQEAHNEKMRQQQKKANEDLLKDEEAKYGQSHKRTQEYLKKQMALTKKGSEEYKELQRKLWEDERKEKEENNKKSLASSKKNAKETAEVEKEMIQLRINAMKEGLNKTITQLEEERKQRLAKLRENGKQYKEAEDEVNRIYDQKILEAKEEWAKKIEKVYKDMWDRINDNALDNAKRMTQIGKDSIEIMKQNLSDNANQLFNQGIGSYGIQGKNQLSPTTQFSLGIISENKSEFISDMKEYIDMLRELQTVQNDYSTNYHKIHDEINKLSDEELGRLNMEMDLQENYYKKLKEEVDEYESYLKETYTEEQVSRAKALLFEENYSSSLSLQFAQRISAIETYWAKRKSMEAEAAKQLYETQLKELKLEYNRESAATWDAYQEEIKQADDFYEKKLDLINQNLKDGTISAKEAEDDKLELEKEYQKASTQMFQNWSEKDEELRYQHNQKVTKLENDKNNNLKALNSEYYQSALQELRDFQTAQSNLENKQPVLNALGGTNFKKTNENYRNLLASYEAMANKIIEKRKEISDDFQNGLIDKDVFDSTIRELENFSANLGEKMDSIKRKLSFGAQFQQFMQDYSQYLQALGSALNSTLSAIADYTDQQYENSINDIEKEIDKIQELYDEQEEILQKHKENVNSIEDELAEARGDRRQHLIDQLNAEIEAQRKAYAEEKRLEKEKKAEEKKRDDEEIDRKRAQQKLARSQAIVNGATAFMNALSQQPIWLGIALAAMTAAMTAVQIATINSQKFADGGVIQGKSHAQGGVKVMGGRAEVEGGEFITNRQTTANNVELLDFINAKHRRLNIDDFIEFYSSGKAKKSIVSMSPRTKFADGGVVPTLNNEYSFDDRLLSAFEDYSNRPVVVSVVDINNKQDDVRRVQTLAGL